ADPAIRLLWWVSVPVWCLFAAASLVKPGQPNWPAPAYVGGFILAVAWVREQLSGTHPRLVRWGIGFSIVAGLGVSLTLHFPDLTRPLIAKLAPAPTESRPYPMRSFDITTRLAGWKELGLEVDSIRTRVRAETGRDPVIAGTHWTLPGTLRFYCPGHPDVFSIGLGNHSDRHSQYDLWHPNPVADAQVFRGRSFVIVGDIGPDTVAAFERCEPRTVFTYTVNGVPL